MPNLRVIFNPHVSEHAESCKPGERIAFQSLFPREPVRVTILLFFFSYIMTQPLYEKVLSCLSAPTVRVISDSHFRFEQKGAFSISFFPDDSKHPLEKVWFVIFFFFSKICLVVGKLRAPAP